MDQSLFTRLVRLQVPTVCLDAQGRSRPSIASLFSWKYTTQGLGLSNLVPSANNTSNISLLENISLANPGFSYDYQLIDVPDFQGNGESEPIPHYYQNLGEAGKFLLTFNFFFYLLVFS